MTPLEMFVDALHLTDPALVEALIEASVPLHLDQGELLIREGEQPTVVPFLLEGIVRGYLFDENGREITDCFAVQPGSPVMPAADLQQPSPLYLEAVVACEFLVVSLADIQRLLGKYEELQQLYHQQLLDSFARHWEIKTTLCRSSAMQRYQWFLEKYPGLIDQVHHRSIASFLGMTPVTLSRQRSALLQETQET